MPRKKKESEGETTATEKLLEWQKLPQEVRAALGMPGQMMIRGAMMLADQRQVAGRRWSLEKAKERNPQAIERLEDQARFCFYYYAGEYADSPAASLAAVALVVAGSGLEAVENAEDQGSETGTGDTEEGPAVSGPSGTREDLEEPKVAPPDSEENR